MTHVDEFNLRDAARNLADAYAELEELKWAKQETKLARKMEPTFGPGSPTPDRDWSLNLEVSLLKETRDERVPGGLLVMAIDALSYTSAAGRAHEVRGGMLCANIYRNAFEIAERFPAATDLLDLMLEQDRFITREIARRFPTPTQPKREEPRHNSTVTIRILGQKGHRVTRDQLNYWAKRGHITRHQLANNRSGWLMSEIIHHINNTTR